MRKFKVGEIVERKGISRPGTGVRGIVIGVGYAKPRSLIGKIQVRWQNLQVSTWDHGQLRTVRGACGCGLSVGPFAD